MFGASRLQLAPNRDVRGDRIDRVAIQHLSFNQAICSVDHIVVRRPSAHEVTTIFNCRRLIEGAAIREARKLDDLEKAGQLPARSQSQYVYLQECIARLNLAVDRARVERDAGRWAQLSAANIGFHKALVALGGSNRLDELMTNIWHEAGLIQQLIDSEQFSTTFFDRNVDINHLIQDGNFDDAEKQLDELLHDAERIILEEFPTAS